MTDAKGAGQAGDAKVDQDDTYASRLRALAGDEAKAKKARIASGERAVEKAEAALKSANQELAKIKKENA